MDDLLVKKGPAPTGDPIEDKRQEYLHSHRALLERQKALSKEASQLFQMANALQANASRKGSQEAMLHELDAIERLARSVKERAKGEKQ